MVGERRRDLFPIEFKEITLGDYNFWTIFLATNGLRYTQIGWIDIYPYQLFHDWEPVDGRSKKTPGATSRLDNCGWA